MRGFTGALGVRCNHCHVGPGPATLEGFDFASDAKETKKVARVMIRMTQEINTRLLPQTGRSPLTEVRCMTCHRGVTKPELPAPASMPRGPGEEFYRKQLEELRRSPWRSAPPPPSRSTSPSYPRSGAPRPQASARSSCGTCPGASRGTVGFGMICYTLPLERYPDTYNGQPLCYAGLAAQKNHSRSI